MNIQGWAEIAVTIGLSVACGWPLGIYMAKVWEGKVRWLAPVETVFYRASGVDPEKGQGWFAYTLSFLAFSTASFLFLYAILRLQQHLPLNPGGFAGFSPDLAFNTAISFVTNTNWQFYSGESAASHLTQMAGLTVQNFASAAAGIAVAAALARAFVAHRGTSLGNFWADLVRITLYILLPLSIVVALVLCALGVPQTLLGHVDATTMEGAKQSIALGPIASQEAIKQIGTNGGGFFNANSSHPFENPNAITNLIEEVIMNMLGFACVVAFGRLVGVAKEARALLVVMVIMVGAAAAGIYARRIAAHSGRHRRPRRSRSEHGRQGGPLRRPRHLGVRRHDHRRLRRRGQRHAREPDAPRRRRGDVHDPPGRTAARRRRLRPLQHRSDGHPGGVRRRADGRPHARIPRQEDRGSKEMQLVMLATLILTASVLGFTGVAVVLPMALKTVSTTGPHGLTEMLYAYTSATGNNGSAFAGLSASPFWNVTMGIAMWLGRFGYAIPVLAIAGGLAAKPRLAPTAGTLPTHGGLFIGLLIGVILILAGLQFFPALALGPIVEHFQMLKAVAGK